MNVIDYCILAIVSLAFIGMTFVTHKVYRIVKFGDKRLMLMLICLDLTLLGMTLNHFKNNFLAHVTFQIVRLLQRNDENFGIPLFLNLLVMLFPVYFLSLAVIFNISKW
jgi:hypothetical protein